MGRWRGLVLGLLTFWLVGCTTSPPLRSTAWLSRFRQFGGGPAGTDIVQLEVAVLERPLGDHYINQDLWGVADEQVVAVERKAVLEDNGFRIGQVGGLVPAQLQALLTSDRSDVNPRCRRLHAGKPATLTLGPVLPQCACQIEQDGRSVPIAAEKVQCSVEVVPTVTADGRIHLQFTPQLCHGDTALMPGPAPDRSGWVLREQRPTERYPALGWEVTLATNEYVVIGGRYDRPQTLGNMCFIQGDEAAHGQRLLVIRASRIAGGSPEPDGPADEDAASRPQTLALQAAWSPTVRGQLP